MNWDFAKELGFYPPSKANYPITFVFDVSAKEALQKTKEIIETEGNNENENFLVLYSGVNLSTIEKPKLQCRSLDISVFGMRIKEYLRDNREDAELLQYFSVGFVEQYSHVHQ